MISNSSTCGIKWNRCSDVLPPLNEVVLTKIDDKDGCRNITKLKRYNRGENCRDLWLFPDGSMYVYYEPTHWQRCPHSAD